MICVLSIIRFKKGKGSMQLKKGRLFLLAGLLVPVVLLGMTSICLAQGDAWTTKANMEVPRYQHATCVVNGKIYAIGGDTNGEGCNWPGSAKVEEYNPSTDTWSIKADMPTARQGLSISAVNGRIYAIGGHPLTCSGELSTVEEYDPQTDTWDTNKTPMPTARGGLSTSVVNGKIYAIGGFNYSAYVAVADVEEYDPTTDTWTAKADMPTARTWLSTCVVNGKIYAFGGHGTIPPIISLKTVEEYDPVTDTWSRKTDIPYTLQNSPASTVNGLIYLFGGSTSPGGRPRSEVRGYNPISNTWSVTSRLPSARVGALSSELNGNIYVIGGSSTSWPFQPKSTVQLYTPPGVTGVEDPFRSEHNPEEFALHQNYPNPFNPTTQISYTLPQATEVTLSIYDLKGQMIRTLVSGKIPAGQHNVIWNAQDDEGRAVASGLYLYRLQTEAFVEVNRMLLIR